MTVLRRSRTRPYKLHAPGAIFRVVLIGRTDFYGKALRMPVVEVYPTAFDLGAVEAMGQGCVGQIVIHKLTPYH